MLMAILYPVPSTSMQHALKKQDNPFLTTSTMNLTLNSDRFLISKRIAACEFHGASQAQPPPAAVLSARPLTLRVRPGEGTVLLLVVGPSKAAAWGESSSSRTPHPDHRSPRGAAGPSSTAGSRATAPRCSCPCGAGA